MAPVPPDRPAAAPSIPALPAAPVLTARDALELRAALIASDYTVEGVGLALGLVGQAALDRSDLSGAARAIEEDSRCATLLRIFVLGRDAPDADVDAALAPLGLARAGDLGLIEPAGPGRTRAALDLRPYGEGDGAGSLPGATPLGPDTAGSWWVLSDLGSDARPDRALRPDHVLGIGAAALTLAQATPRTRVARALDVGTGCGIQALHLSQHADVVVATDMSARAVALAQATAALNGLAWEVRQGDLLEPVRGEQFDLIVANPPFVVGPGWLGDAAGADTGIDGASDSVPSGYDYRDSGLEGDEISARLVRGLPALLAPGGTAQLLANWIIPDDGDWAARVSGWLEGSGCDAWIWQRELADPGEYVSLWLRDAGETPGTPAWDGRYAQWLDWFDATSTRAVGMGLITLRRTASAAPVVVCEDVRQAVEQPSGAHIAAWFDRLDWLRAHDGRLGAATLRRAPDLVLTTHATAGPDGWAPQVLTLRQGGGLRWEVDADAAIAALVAGCTGEVTVAELSAVLALSLGAPAQDVLAALTPVLVDLIRRGLLEPTT
ncbi:MAG: methyltransferase [Pseudonocardiales bacterium]|nr:methyltransferase [Pseudonocardiales bacterium]